MVDQKVHQRTLPVLANIFVLISIAEQIQLLSLSFIGKLSFSLSTLSKHNLTIDKHILLFFNKMTSFWL